MEHGHGVLLTYPSHFLPSTRPPPLSLSLLSSPSFDAFKDSADGTTSSSAQKDKVHVRIQQRNGRKCITTVEGLAEDLDLKSICKAFKKNFSCNGAVQNDDKTGRDVSAENISCEHYQYTLLA